MRIRLIVPVYSTSVWVVRCVESATSRSHAVEAHLFLHSEDSATRAACRDLARHAGVTLHEYGVNRGLSRTWNDGLLRGYADGADVVVIANDDIAFSTGDIDRLAEAATDQRDHYIVSCAGDHGQYERRLPSHGYACFAINPVAIEALGCFDENIFPAYCEDQDYSLRARLSGLREANCGETNVFHAGSTAIASDPERLQQNAATMTLNQAYYRRKWGGDGDHEVYERPFDDPRFDLRIPPERRAHPYGPGFDRTDVPD